MTAGELASCVVRVLRDGPVDGTGLSSWETAYAVARAESGGRPDAIGDGGNSFGLWQVYVPAHPQWSGAWLLNPDNNAAAMSALSGGGRSWTPWCTWDRPACGGVGNGSYRNYLGEARAAFAPWRIPTLAPPPAAAPPASSAAWLLVAAGGAALLLAARRSS